MMKVIFSRLALCFFVICNLLLSAQPSAKKMTVSDYIATYKSYAIREMKEYQIPASIILAQGIIETNCGNSQLTRQSNNHFGIKCHKDWTGDTIHVDDDAPNECFRKYRNAGESYRDHSLFLKLRSRYAFLFSIPVTDYKGWANGLQKAGYATNKHYAESLIRVIEENHLYEFDGENAAIAQLKAVKEKLFSCGHFLQGYEQPTAGKFEVVKTSPKGRKIYLNNGLKFIFAQKDDNYLSLAKEFNVYAFQILRFNDLSKDDCLQEGQIIYLERKKRKAADEIHMVKPNENLYSIAQLYGMKLKLLSKRNRMHSDDALQSGQKLWLRSTKPKKD